MNKRFGPVLFILVLIWAVTSTYMYLRLKNNPMVVAVTTGMNSSPLSQESFQLSEMEKVTFLRQYLDRYFNYDANNFWQSQTSLSFLMAPDLRDRRIAEVRRLREKVQQKNISQKAQLLSLKSLGQNRFEAMMKVQITEEQNKTSDLTMTLQMELGKTERTLENPWGLLVQRMDFTNSSSGALSFDPALKIKEKTPLIVTLPCAIENIESSDEAVLQTKITTWNVSEIQLTTRSEEHTSELQSH